MTRDELIARLRSTESLEYWRAREEEQKAHHITDLDDYNAELNKIYSRAITDCENQINDWYMRYADKEGISMAEAKKRVATADQEYYAKKAEEYVATKDLSPTANSEMRLYNLTMKVNRLELLKANLGMAVTAAGSDAEKLTGALLDKKALEELQRQAGILGKGVDGQEARAKKIVNASFKNATYSERLWNDIDALRQRINIQVQRSLIRGLNPVEIARGFLPELQKDVAKTRYATERLARTEMSRVLTDAQMDSFKKNGYDEFMVICEATACKLCQPYDGEHYKIDDMEVALNAPPFHPNCLCSTAAYMDETSLEELIKEIEAEREGTPAAEPEATPPVVPPPVPEKKPIEKMYRKEVQERLDELEGILADPTKLTNEEYLKLLDERAALKERKRYLEYDKDYYNLYNKRKKITKQLDAIDLDKEYVGIYKEPIRLRDFDEASKRHTIKEKIDYFRKKMMGIDPSVNPEEWRRYRNLWRESEAFESELGRYRKLKAEADNLEQMQKELKATYKQDIKALKELAKAEKPLLLIKKSYLEELSKIDTTFGLERFWKDGSFDKTRVTAKEYTKEIDKRLTDFYIKQSKERIKNLESKGALTASEKESLEKYKKNLKDYQKLKRLGKKYLETSELIAEVESRLEVLYNPGAARSAGGSIKLADKLPKSMEKWEQNIERYSKSSSYGSKTNEEKLQSAIDKVRKEVKSTQGIDLPEDFVEQQFQKFFEANSPKRRITFKHFEEMIDQNEFKSQLQTGTGEGAVYSKGDLNSPRAKVSEKLFGHNRKTLKPEDFEKYGYLGGDDHADYYGSYGATQYGEVMVTFKRDVLRRTTFTVEDSLGNGSNEEVIGTPAAAPSRYSIPTSWGTYDTIRTLADMFINGDTDIFEFNNRAGVSYTELQYHGKLTFDDVEKIGFKSQDRMDRLPKEYQEKLKAMGIKLYVVSK